MTGDEPIRVAGRTPTEGVIDLRGTDLDPETVVRSIRSESNAVAVEAPAPGPAHEHAGLVAADVAVPLGPTLAAVARSWGHRSTYAPAITATREAIADLETPTPTLDDARAAVAETAPRLDPHRERVATRRGELVAAREDGDDVEDEAAALRAAARRLSSVETAHFATLERLEQARAAARTARDRRERRLELEDRLGNRLRDARRELARTAAPVVARGLGALPVGATLDPTTLTAEGESIGLLAGAARAGRLRAPIVVPTDRFDPPARAARLLDTTVVRV